MRTSHPILDIQQPFFPAAKICKDLVDLIQDSSGTVGLQHNIGSVHRQALFPGRNGQDQKTCFCKILLIYCRKPGSVRLRHIDPLLRSDLPQIR